MKQHTIIFVPHARAQFRKWRVTTLQVTLGIGAVVLVTLASILATWHFFDTSFDREQLEKIEGENADLRVVNQRFESNIRELETQLSDYQERIHKLAIVAGLAELAPTTEPGIGGLDASAVSDADALFELRQRAEGLNVIVDKVEDQLDERQMRVSRMPTVSPVRGIFTSGFGYRPDPFNGRRAFHQGIDITAPYGKEVMAPGDGIVTKAGRASGYGLAVYISHGYGITTRYGHLSRITVEPGQQVRRGDVIGHLGSSGRATGNHLHYEVRVDGSPENPLGYILDDAH